MAVLNTKERKALPTRDFAGPGRTYPVEDAAHARNALSRASTEYRAGRISRAIYDRIVRKAKRVLARADKGDKK